jgi:hypothetical protein
MTTRYRIAEQVIRIVSGGNVSDDNPIDIREVMLLVDQERDSLIKTEIMDWTYTKSTATAKGELEISGAWLTSKRVKLTNEASHLNGIVYAPLADEDGNRDNTKVISYISLPNDMGMYRVAADRFLVKKASKVINIKGKISKGMNYKRDSVEILFNIGPKVLDKSYQVSFDFTIGTTLLSDGTSTQHQYGGVRTHKITFNVDIKNNDGFQNTHLNFVKAMVNSPGFKKFVNDFDIKYGVTESTTDGGQENYILEGSDIVIMYLSQIKLSTSYGSNISNFTINGSGPRSQNSNGNENGGAAEVGGSFEDNIGLGWTIVNSSVSTGDASEDSADPFETGHENSHGIGFLINDTLYSTEFISSEVEVTSDDLIVNFIIKNAEKIAKEQNISVTRVDTTLPPFVPTEEVETNPFPIFGLSFEEIEPSGGFDLDILTPGNAFLAEINTALSQDSIPMTNDYKPIVFTRMPSGGDHNLLYDKTVKKSGRKFYYIESNLNKPRLYFYNHYSLNALPEFVNLTYIATSESFQDKDPYPIPSDYEKIIIRNLVEMFSVMRKAADDMTNDNNK